MRGLKNVLVVLLALAWLPLTMHCQLESVTDFALLDCADTGAGHGAPATDPDCGGPSCCAAERSLYKSEQPRLRPIPVLLLALAVAPDLDAVPTDSNQPDRAGLTLTAPELPRRWQFVFRTASPPRAPSFAS